MFYAASVQQIEQLYPYLINYEPEKTRIVYTHEDGTRRFVDRIAGYYFSDKPWGLGEDERQVEGLDQEWAPNEDYLSLNIRNSIKAPDGWTFVSCDFSAEELRLGALNTKGKAFMDAFKHNEDVHLSVAKAMFGEEAVKENKKKYRSIAKGCNSIDALYPTENGYKKLSETDHILDLNGNKQKFINIVEDRNMFRLHLSNGQVIDVTTNHKYKDMSMLYPEYKELYEGMQIGLVKTKYKTFSKNYDYTHSYTTLRHNQYGSFEYTKTMKLSLNRDLGYLIGIYLGDGYIPKSEKSINICCNKSNSYYLESILNTFKSTRYGAKECGRIDEKNYTLLSLGNSLFTSFILDNFGRTDSKHIGDIIYTAPLEFSLGILEGLLDSDGSVYSDSASFFNTNENLFKDVAKMVAFLGIPAKAIQKNYTYKGVTKPFYYLYILDCRLLNFHVDYKRKAFKNVLSRYLSYNLKDVVNSKYNGKYYDKLNLISKGMLKSLTCRAIEKYIPDLEHNKFWPVTIEKIELIKGKANIMECETHYYEAEGYYQHNCNFALQYGGSPAALSRSAGLTPEEAQHQYDAYMLAQADHFAVQNAQVRNTHRTLCEYSFFGLPVRLHNYYNSTSYSMVSAGERLAKNHRIQACLPYTTKILTNLGYIPIGKLYDEREKHFNTMVWTGFEWTHFTPVYKGKDKLCRIIFDNGKILNCDSRHKLKVIGDKTVDWVSLPNLKEGDAIAFSKVQNIDYVGISPQQVIGKASSSNVPGLTNYKYPDITFNRDDILDMCYMYGSILGDGNINPTKGEMSISMTWGYTKFDNIPRFTKLLDKYNIYYNIKTTNPYILPSGKMSHELKTLAIYCAPLVRAFQELFGINTYENAHTKRIHDIVYTYDKEMIRLILEGLYDTDGVKFNHSGDLHLCNSALVQDVQLLQRLLGFNSKIFYRMNSTYLCNTSSTYVDYLKGNNTHDNTLGQTLPYHNYIFQQRFLTNPYPKGSSKYVIFNKLNTTYGNKRGERCYLSTFREMMSELGQKFEDYDYARIVSIEFTDEEIDTYTLTVNNPLHQYDSEGVISKNTGADVLSIAFIKLWKDIWEQLGHPEDYIRFQITVHDEIDFIIKNEVLDILVPKVIQCMQTQMPDWEIPLTIGLSFGPTFGQQYEWEYDPNTFAVIGPKLEMPKESAPKEKKDQEQIQQEEQITISF